MLPIYDRCNPFVKQNLPEFPRLSPRTLAFFLRVGTCLSRTNGVNWTELRKMDLSNKEIPYATCNVVAAAGERLFRGLGRLSGTVSGGGQGDRGGPGRPEVEDTGGVEGRGAVEQD